MKITIDRTKWSRGDLASNALLVGRNTLDRSREGNESAGANRPLPELGKMCCLGFACLALGATPDQIRDKPMPRDVSDEVELPGLRKLCNAVWECSVFARNAAVRNDSPLLDDQRELQLKQLASEAGFEFEFVN